MSFLEQYPISLKMIFGLLLGSIICYLVNIILVIYSRAYNIFAIRLFLYFCFSQLCIMISQFIVPFLTNPDGDPTFIADDDESFINHKQCQYQGGIAMFGWISASYLSVYMEYCVLQALLGREHRKGWDELYWVGSIYLISFIPNMFFATKGSYIPFGWNDQGRDILQFCMLELTTFNFFFILTEDIGCLVLMIYLYMKIRKRQQILRKFGVIITHPILNAHYLSITHISIWSLNAGIKVLDKKNLYQGGNAAILWQILNMVYGLEALVVTFIFFYFYLPYLRTRLGEKLFLFLERVVSCCKRKQKRVVSCESLIAPDDSILNSFTQSALKPNSIST